MKFKSNSEIKEEKEIKIFKRFKCFKRFTSRYEESEGTDILMNSKIVVCDIMKIIFDLRNDNRITFFLFEFFKETKKLKIHQSFFTIKKNN